MPFLSTHTDNSFSIPPLETAEVRYDVEVPAGVTGPHSSTIQPHAISTPNRHSPVAGRSIAVSRGRQSIRVPRADQSRGYHFSRARLHDRITSDGDSNWRGGGPDWRDWLY